MTEREGRLVRVETLYPIQADLLEPERVEYDFSEKYQNALRNLYWKLDTFESKVNGEYFRNRSGRPVLVWNNAGIMIWEMFWRDKFMLTKIDYTTKYIRKRGNTSIFFMTGKRYGFNVGESITLTETLLKFDLEDVEKLTEDIDSWTPLLPRPQTIEYAD